MTLLLPLIPQQGFWTWPRREKAPCDPSPVRYVDAAELLTAEYDHDAHFAAYSTPGIPYRLNLDALGRLPDGWVMALFAVDVDHPRHKEKPDTDAGKEELAAWVERWRAEEQTKRAGLEAAHPGAFSYDTRGGYRLVWRLPAPVVVQSLDDKETWRSFYRRSLLQLVRETGIVGDPACADLTRLYRLPHATREGRGTPERLPVRGDPAALGAWSYQPGRLDVDLDTCRELAKLPGGPGLAWASVLKALTPAAPAEGDAVREWLLRSEDQDQDRLIRRATGWLRSLTPPAEGNGANNALGGACNGAVRGFCLGEAIGVELVLREYVARSPVRIPRSEVERTCHNFAVNGTNPWGFKRDAEGGEAGLRNKPSERRTRAGTTTNGHPMTDDGGAVGAELLQHDHQEEEAPFLPLETPHDLPAFPLDALPREVRAFVGQLAEYLECPIDLPACLALGALGSAAMKRYAASPRVDWLEPLNIYVAVALEPGESKSPAFRQVFAPLYALQKEMVEAWKVECKRIADSNASRGKGEPEEEKPVRPRLFIDDATPEKTGAVLAEQGERITIASDEGTAFQQMAGMYAKNGQANVGVYLKGHDGGDFMVDRLVRDSIHLESPLLTVALAVQPTVIRGLAKHPDLRGRGLWARFVYAMPASRVGTRTFDTPPVDPAVKDGWKLLVQRLASGPLPETPEVLHFTPEASARFHRASLEIESAMDPGRSLYSVRDWANKLRGFIARVAGLLHVADELAPETARISLATVERALEIGRFFARHALHVFNVEMSVDPSELAARVAWQVIERKGVDRVTPGQVSGWVRSLRKTADARAALEVLAERGYLKREPAPSKGYARRLTASDDSCRVSDSGSKAVNKGRTPSVTLSSDVSDERPSPAVTPTPAEAEISLPRQKRQNVRNDQKAAPAEDTNVSSRSDRASETPPPVSAVEPIARPGVASTTPTAPPSEAGPVAATGTEDVLPVGETEDW